MKNYIIWGVLTVANILLGVYIYQQKQQTEQFYEDYAQKSVLSYDYLKSMQYNGNVIDSSVALLDSKDSSYTMGDIACGGRILVFRYSFIHCNACVDTLMKLVGHFSKEVGAGKIAILAQYANKRDYKNFVRINNVKNGMFHLQDTLCKADELSIPYLFVLEGDMTISNFFMPRKEYPQITEQYLQSIKNLLIHTK